MGDARVTAAIFVLVFGAWGAAERDLALALLGLLGAAVALAIRADPYT